MNVLLVDDVFRQAVIEGCGYTVRGSHITWYALLPGHKEFRREEATGEDETSANVRENFLGFFSSKEDLLQEVYETVLDEIEFAFPELTLERLDVSGTGALELVTTLGREARGLRLRKCDGVPA